jgi:hypothetical protein
MPLIPYSIPPGVYKNGTRYQAKGRFWDADLWRWPNNTSRPIGGWRQRTDDIVPGAVRSIYTWRANDNQSWAGLGSNEGLFVMNRPGVVSDITPVGFTPTSANAETGGGYGRGKYGRGRYGTPRPDVVNTIPVSVWSLDNWGEYLVACYGEDIYEWQLDTGTPAAVIANSPTAEAILATEQRSLMAIGSDGDPRAVDWSDLEDNTDWTPTATNQAGGRRLQTSGALKCGRRIRGGQLIFSDTDVHLSTYVGLPIVYSFERLATDCGVISKNSPVCVDDRAWWMGTGGFWTYDGFVKPMECDVYDHVFNDMNTGQSSKVAGAHNSEFGEIWWFYPSASSVEINRYVFYSYREGYWGIGNLVRLCAAPRGEFAYPIMVDDAGAIYEHEVGQQRDGRNPVCESGPIEIGQGDRLMDVSAIIPDENNLGDVAVSFINGDYPLSEDSEVASVTALDKTDVRFQARRVSVVMTAVADRDFRVGVFRFDARSGSGR